MIPLVIASINLSEALRKKPPKDFWKDPLKKLKGGNPYARATAYIGVILMIIAQFYSVVKRVGGRLAIRLGGLSRWLAIHMVLDTIGPLIVLIHAGILSKPKFLELAWLFHETKHLIAGAPALLAPIIVLSGFFGRYIYRRLPQKMGPFRYWRKFHIALTAVFYVLGILHLIAGIKGFEHIFEAED